jgi:hypothetical protein
MYFSVRGTLVGHVGDWIVVVVAAGTAVIEESSLGDDKEKLPLGTESDGDIGKTRPVRGEKMRQGQ